MELKEAIEILGNLKDYLQIKIDIGYHKLSYNDLGWDFKTIDSITAIDTVLEELEKHKEHENQYMNAEIFSAKQLKAIEKDYIHKDKIKEKIEELKAVTETCYGRIKYQEGKIVGLEELLKGE